MNCYAEDTPSYSGGEGSGLARERSHHQNHPERPRWVVAPVDNLQREGPQRFKYQACGMVRVCKNILKRQIFSNVRYSQTLSQSPRWLPDQISVCLTFVHTFTHSHTHTHRVPKPTRTPEQTLGVDQSQSHISRTCCCNWASREHLGY